MHTRDIKILFLTSHCPSGRSYGTQIRTFNIVKTLGRLGKVSLIVAPWFPIDKESVDKTGREFNLTRIAYLARNEVRNPIVKVRRVLDPSFLNTDGIMACTSDREAVSRMIVEHDIVWVHTILTANAFQIFKWPHAVLDIDDIPSRLFYSAARFEKKAAKILDLYRKSLLWRCRERILKRRFDVIAVCSNEDRRYLGDDGRIQVIPNGFSMPQDVPYYSPTVPAKLGFIGTFRYEPNRKGIEWFIQNAWPMVKRSVPNAKLKLIGLGSDEYYANMGADIDGLGYVEDPTKEIASWSAMIVPVIIGGGTRIKIAEAFSRKCPVVSTSLGAFGYDVVDQKDLIIADNPKEFASACVRLLTNRELGRIISENGWKKYLQNWTWDAIGASVSKTVEKCLKRDNKEWHLSIS